MMNHSLKRLNLHTLARTFATGGGKKAPKAKKKEHFIQKSVRVSVLGGDTVCGEYVCLLLKQNPLVSHVYVQGTFNSPGIAAELRHIDTRCDCTAYIEHEVEDAIKSADIVLLLSEDKNNIGSNMHDMMKMQLKRLDKMAHACSQVAPKAILVVCVNPVSISLPLVSEIYRKTNWYHPGRVLGSVALQQIQANSLLARFLDLDPSCVHVPLIGGAEIDCLVPLFSRATPTGVSQQDAKCLIKRFRHEDEMPKDACGTSTTNLQNISERMEYAAIAEAYALNRMVTAMALGICGDRESLSTAFVRTNMVGSCRHMTATCRFGLFGMNHNYGLPQLTPLELKLFEAATRKLARREKLALHYLAHMKSETFKIPDPKGGMPEIVMGPV